MALLAPSRGPHPPSLPPPQPQQTCKSWVAAGGIALPVGDETAPQSCRPASYGAARGQICRKELAAAGSSLATHSFKSIYALRALEGQQDGPQRV